MANFFLTFSDSAKYAQAAISLLSGHGLTVTHVFFSPERLSQTRFPLESSPITPILMALPLKLFGRSDQSIIFAGLLLLLLTLIVLFITAQKISGRWGAIIAPLTFMSIPFVWNYYWNFSTEAVAMLFLALATCSFLFKKSRFLALFFGLLSILARPQLICLPLAFLITQKKYLLSGLAIIIIGAFGLSYRQAIVSLNFAPGVPQGQYLRGREVPPLSLPKLASKVFYNTYNFIKSPDRIVPVVILAVSLIKLNHLSFFTFASSVLLIIMSSLTLPNARYIHPILPLFALSFAKNLPPKKWSVLILLLILIPAAGKYALDQRGVYNPNPPIYKQIAEQMAEVLPKDEVIVTNLDAWAAWYHDLTTVWFPNSVSQISSRPPKYIAISDYLKDDADFALNDWPNHPYINNNYFILRDIAAPDYHLTIWQKNHEKTVGQSP